MDWHLRFTCDRFQARLDARSAGHAKGWPSRYRVGVQLRIGVPSGATLVLLARHAESEFNAQKRFCGRSEAGLSALGVAQARALAGRLGSRVDEVYSSRQGRAIETARALAEPQLLPGIEELDQGELEGLTFSQAYARYPDFFAQWRSDPESVREPLGESLAQLRERVMHSLHRLVRSKGQRGKNLLVVGHQLAWASCLAELRAVTAARWNEHALPNARFARLWWVEERWCCDPGPKSFDVDYSGPESVGSEG
jgi:broad specificity phosphatase PhoE